MVDYNIPVAETVPLGLDTASRLDADAVVKSPYCLVARYLSSGGTALPEKQLTPAEASSYVASDIAVVSVWETTADMMLGGYAAGQSDSTLAWIQHQLCYGPDSATIYFACDFDEAPNQDEAIADYLKGCIAFRNGDQSKVGIYGSYYICMRMQKLFPQIKTWQTMAWSGGLIYPACNMLQRTGYIQVGGVECDVNEIHTPGYVGAWQDGNDMGPIISLIDNKQYTPEQMAAFYDFHLNKIHVAMDLLVQHFTGSTPQ